MKNENKIHKFIHCVEERIKKLLAEKSKVSIEKCLLLNAQITEANSILTTAKKMLLPHNPINHALNQDEIIGITISSHRNITEAAPCEAYSKVKNSDYQLHLSATKNEHLENKSVLSCKNTINEKAECTPRKKIAIVDGGLPHPEIYTDEIISRFVLDFFTVKDGAYDECFLPNKIFQFRNLKYKNRYKTYVLGRIGHVLDQLVLDGLLERYSTPTKTKIRLPKK